MDSLPVALPTRTKVKVTAMPGDGIGPEVMKATQTVLAAAGAQVEWEEALAGAEAFRRGISTGAPQETLDSIARNGVALKGPLETPVGHGEKSANVALRKTFEMYGNVRPVRELPGIRTPFSGRGIDFVVVRENVEDVYAGIEHMQTPGVAQCLKIITEVGCERIVRLAAAVAEAEGRKKVTVATKANIMKLTEGMLKRVGEAVLKDHPSLAHEHMIVDNCAHQMVIRPEQFDVTVMTNMNGDILSDLAAGLVGGLGVAPSANLGDEAAMFEAVHGSAPQIAGKGIANPTALLLSALMMLRHIGDFATARRIEHALYVTLEEGRDLTGDIARDGEGVPTAQYVDRIIANLGRESEKVPEREYRPMALKRWPQITWYRAASTRELVGVDVFVESERDPRAISITLQAAAEGSAFDLTMIGSRGAQVWPEVGGHTFLVDHFRARFMFKEPPKGNGIAEITDLLQRIGRQHNWMHIEKLQRFDGADAYSKA
ncbi:NADP-dependent isocitrate dehydrogenase [Paracraurococcus lichenis]|uniref:Isocitrate dehydrogenase [NADP] n=1 Tax=Paracraurococcus lichenis TaxID=3064888 RepID=A0ABT9DV39_9PROT|nr:NADP-dependent isocitrate dehydrogenase [Paracraurococcus sp. LOR1-02]MDO9707768.1 NADP-dependent isocitrate dehydrogenase [Paracraurococcus sp. LOR1-02]